MVNENDKMLSEFMGAKVVETYFKPDGSVDHYLMDYGRDNHMPDNSRYHATTSMKYHTSDNWIIPVLRKLESLDFPEGKLKEFKNKLFKTENKRFPATKQLYETAVLFLEVYQEVKEITNFCKNENS